jgi:hypothetical protein
MPALRIISELLFQYPTRASNSLVFPQGAHGHNVLAASRHLKTKTGVEEASFGVAFCLNLEAPRAQKKA